MALDRCPACGGGGARPFFASRLAWSLRSDGGLLHRRARVLRCRGCGHLFKPRSLVAACSDYARYHAYGDDPRKDKVDFSGAAPTTRSGAILAFLRGRRWFERRTRILDFGCHRGAFLSLLRNGRHAGFDVAERYRPIIEGLGHGYYSPRRPPPPGLFDLLTLIHVFEHFVDPVRDLGPGLAALKPGGRVLVQVPDPWTKPTDLYWMDHRSHFSPRCLDEALRALGCVREGPHRRIVPGELTAVYRRAEGRAPAARRETSAARERIRASLASGEGSLLRLRRAGVRCVLYGTGLLAALVHKILGRPVDGAIDDNVALHGGRWRGVPVVGLDQVPRGALVVVAVPTAVAPEAARRCRSRGLRVEPLFLPGPAVRISR